MPPYNLYVVFEFTSFSGVFLIQLCLSQSLNASASKSPSVQRTFIIEIVVTDLRITRQKSFYTSIDFSQLYKYFMIIIDSQNPLGLRLFNWFPQSPDGLQRIYRFVNCFITSTALKTVLDSRYTVVR